MARTRLLLPSPCGRTTVPRTIWSACFGSTPSRSDSRPSRRTSRTSPSARAESLLRSYRPDRRRSACWRRRISCRASSWILLWCKRAPWRSHSSGYREIATRQFRLDAETSAPSKSRPCPLSDYVEAHRTGRSRDGLDRRLQRSELRSGIFSLAISSTCFAVTVPTLVLFGSADPFAMLAARFSSTAPAASW